MNSCAGFLGRQTAANRHREWLHRPEHATSKSPPWLLVRAAHGHNLCEVADADIDAAGEDFTVAWSSQVKFPYERGC